MKAFKVLFSPIKIGTMELKNRIAMPAMGTNYAEPDGMMSEREIAWHVARARGGCALNVTEIANIDPLGKGIPGCPSIWDDKFIPGFAELAKAIHTHSGKLAIQLHHAGRGAMSMVIGDQKPVGPSAISYPPSPGWPFEVEPPRELTEDEIWDLIDKFGEGARRARDAGADAVELHGGHGYGIAQFMSAESNKRTDSFGGSLGGRMKFPVEIIKSIRSKVGADYPIVFKICGQEMVAGGRTLEETVVAASILEDAGADCICVSRGSYSSLHYVQPPAGLPQGAWLFDVEAVKKAVSIPVMAVGKIGDPLFAEHILRQGKADLVAMGRGLIADPDLPNKAAEGRLDDIRYCIYCNTCIHELNNFPGYVRCAINAEAGRETEMTMTPTKKPKKVLVAGGGPGGLEAARVAALRGHKVTLYEQSDKLGGQFRIASIPPMKQELTMAIKYLSGQVKKAGVKVEMGKKVTPEVVEELKPDVVIVATGGQPLIPRGIPGANRKRVVTAHDVLTEKVRTGHKVAILGGGMVGCETAEFLSQRAKDVTIIEMLDDIAMDVGMFSKPYLMERLDTWGVKAMTGAQVKEITGDGVVVEKDGKKETISGIDTVVLAMGAKPVKRLAAQLKGKVAEVYVIGDASEPRMVVNAVAEGSEIARKI
jgi:2,4-dienoyl-CoA reductase-like NADH-dependent reductase (Old Yellow Enzyme family)/thioredoxin reductase